jgi:uncharacterized membrane protein YfcA
VLWSGSSAGPDLAWSVSVELSQAELALCVGFVLGAYFIRGIAGFGSGLIAIPLLALVLPLHLVVPAIALTDYLASASQGIGNRRDILWRALLPVLPFVLLGVGSALYLFQQVDPGVLTQVLGVFVICYAVYALLGLHPGRIARPHWAAPLGGLGALVGTLFGTGGPFYVAYLQLWGPSKGQFRATAATAFLVEGSMRMTGYLMAGFFTRDVLLFFAMALPIMALGLYAGHYVHMSLSEAGFRRLIGAILLGSGAALVLK